MARPGGACACPGRKANLQHNAVYSGSSDGGEVDEVPTAVTTSMQAEGVRRLSLYNTVTGVRPPCHSGYVVVFNVSLSSAFLGAVALAGGADVVDCALRGVSLRLPHLAPARTGS